MLCKFHKLTAKTADFLVIAKFYPNPKVLIHPSIRNIRTVYSRGKKDTPAYNISPM